MRWQAQGRYEEMAGASALSSLAVALALSFHR